MNNFLTNNRGAAAIVFTMLVVLVMVFVAMASATIIQNGIKSGRAHLESTKAYYGAEAGAERILWEIRKNGFDPVADLWISGDCVRFTANPGPIHLSNPTTPCTATPQVTQTLPFNGTTFTTRYDLTAPVVTLTNLGNYDDLTRRAVEIKYTD